MKEIHKWAYAISYYYTANSFNMEFSGVSWFLDILGTLNLFSSFQLSCFLFSSKKNISWSLSLSLASLFLRYLPGEFSVFYRITQRYIWSDPFVISQEDTGTMVLGGTARFERTLCPTLLNGTDTNVLRSERHDLSFRLRLLLRRTRHPALSFRWHSAVSFTIETYKTDNHEVIFAIWQIWLGQRYLPLKLTLLTHSISSLHFLRQNTLILSQKEPKPLSTGNSRVLEC